MEQEGRHRELTIEERLRILERGHGVLTDQMAEIVVKLDDMKSEMREAVSEGIVSGFDKLLDRGTQKAAEKTGRWIWAFVKDTLGRWFLIGAIVVSVGKAAGWQAAQAVWDAITGGKR